MAELLRDLLARHPRAGTVEWIGLSPGRREPLTEVEMVEARIGTGLEGDRHGRSGRGKRQVTLVQVEHLAVVGSLVEGEVEARDLRRNLAVRGINLHALRRSRFRVGAVLLEGTGPCAPCSRLEETLGPGGYNACRGHGGITAIVLEPGIIRLGDPVSFVENLDRLLGGEGPCDSA